MPAIVIYLLYGRAVMLGSINMQILTLTVASLIAWTGQRLGTFAIPFIVLAHTESVWATGLTAGCTGLPLITSMWWGKHLRRHLRSPQGIAGLAVIQAIGVSLIPIAVALGLLHVTVLIASGLITGIGAALQPPALKTIATRLADDPGAPHRVTRALAWQDLAQRLPMIFAPLIGALLLDIVDSSALLVLQVALLLISGYLLWQLPTPHYSVNAPAEGRSFRNLLRNDRQIAAAIALSGMGGFFWFALPLGLALLGAERGAGPSLAAAGLSGYGIATVVTSLSAPLMAPYIPRLPTILFTWFVQGVSFVLLPMCSDTMSIAVTAGVGGSLVPLGNIALNALISELPSDAERHGAFTAHTVFYSGGTSIGLMVGGTTIALFGSEPMIMGAGLALAMSASVTAAFFLWGRKS